MKASEATVAVSVQVFGVEEAIRRASLNIRTTR